jgi:VWFA-related protein
MARPLQYCVGVAVTSALVLTASAQEPARPQFRAGVTITRLEVTVLDKRTRTPVKGLTADDFVIKVNGERQPVVSVAEVIVPAAAPDAARALAEAADDVATNASRPSRLFVLILNDSGGGRAPFYGITGRAIAHQFIDRLGPDDRAAVIFVRDNSPAQDFTRDRTLLRRAIDRYDPGGGLPCALTVVRRTQEFLQAMPGYRRAIVFVSPVGIGSCIDPDWYLQQIGFAARFAHVPVYTFSAHGLEAPRPDDLRPGNLRGNPFARYDGHVELLRTMAGLTEGRATVHTNAPADAVPAVFDELGSYYAVAYEHQYPDDGRLRRLEVEVTRPDAVVVSSRALVETRRSSEAAADALTPGSGRASGLMDALEAPLASGNLTLRLSSLPLAVPEVREQALALTLSLPPSTRAEEFRVQLLVFDGEGRRQLSSQTLDLGAPTGAGDAEDDGPEVALRLDLRPGRYNLRLVAERRRDGLAGSIHATVVVPDFARDRLSLSGVAISRAGGLPLGNRAALDGLLPIAPTAIREFSSDDRVGAFLRVHRSTGRPPQPVVLETEVIDAAGALVVTATRTIGADAFDARATAEQRFDLPLTQLDAGVYLLRFVATAGEERAQRDVRFSVK